MSLKKAAHLIASIQFTDYQGAGLNIAGFTVLKFMLKRSESDPDVNALITKDYAGGGVTITDLATGMADALLTASDLNGIPSSVYAEAMVIVGGTVVRTETQFVTFSVNVIKAIA